MKTFLCEYIHEEARRELASFSEIISDWSRLSEADAMINRNLTLTAEIIKSATNLKVIAIHGTGIDGVDMGTAKERGIEVFSVPHQNAASVAELNIALMLGAARKFSLFNRFISTNTPMGDPETVSLLCGTELTGKTVAFLGVGEISRRTAVICQKGFAMRTLGWSRSLTPDKAAKYGIEFCNSMQEAVKDADFTVIGMALTCDTRHIVDANILNSMKKGAILINTARGALIDEDALLEAIESHHLAGAALDVIESEPVTSKNALYRLPQVMITPHIGANTEEALYRVGMACVRGIRERLEQHCRHK